MHTFEIVANSIGFDVIKDGFCPKRPSLGRDHLRLWASNVEILPLRNFPFALVDYLAMKQLIIRGVWLNKCFTMYFTYSYNLQPRHHHPFFFFGWFTPFSIFVQP